MTLRFIANSGRDRDDRTHYYNYEFHSDNPNEYWLLTYCRTRKKWFADLYEDLNGTREFDQSRWAEPYEITRLLEALPVTALPVDVFI